MIKDAHFEPEKPNFKQLVLLSIQQLTNFPYIEADFDAITNYQLLCKVVEYLNKVIANENQQNETIISLYNTFVELKDYVDNYFDNLDVQENINNKLDEMLENGELEQIIEQFIQSSALWCFDTVADMKNATNLTNGSFTKTLGYYSINDGGESIYKIRTKTSDDVIDNGSIISLSNDSLIAELIVNDSLNSKQFGCLSDGINDDLIPMQNLFDYVKKRNKSIKIIIIGTSYISDRLTLHGNNNNHLKGITITGNSGSSSYNNNESLINGFLFQSQNINYSNYYNLSFEYVDGLKIDSLKIRTNEEVVQGKIPYNGNIGIHLFQCKAPQIINNNITSFYRGLTYTTTSGISTIENNNIALCNVGIQTGGSGDSSIINNHINTMGFDIYDIDGNIDPDYIDMYNNNRVYGIGIYVGSSGNISVQNGKIEWCNIGIWQDYANGMIYDSIRFDRCSLVGIVIRGGFHPYSSGIITNNIFYGCGGIKPTVTYQDKHIGNENTGYSISLNRTNNVIISNNKILGDNGRLIGAFKSNMYYGPADGGILAYKCNNSSVLNNIISSDATYSCNFTDSIIEYNNNITNKSVYYDNNKSLTYIQNGNNKIFTCANPNNVQLGNFTTKDIIISSSNPLNGWKVTSSGTKNTINASVSVITNETEYFPGDGSVVKLNGDYNDISLNIGNIVSITGVTGNKTITNIIENNGSYYLKLNSPCDVAVLNATMTNVIPSFESVTIIN